MKKIITCAALAAFLVGCQSVPYTERSRFLMSSEEDEAVLGVEAWAEILKKETITQNATYINAVNRVSRNVARVADQPDYKWEFKVFESPQANAFCLPGGKIGVYTGLFQYTANDAELATVIAHEVGHALARHGGERMTQEQVKNLGGTMLDFVVPGDYSTVAATVYGLGAEYGVLLPYSRNHEHESDQIGLLLMTKAGYNPSAAFSFWQKFGSSGSFGAVGEYFSTHPIGPHRIDHMKKFLSEATENYKNAKPQLNLGTVYK